MDELKQAINLIRSGEKRKARRILVDILKNDPNHEQAWQYMILCAANPRQLEISIHNVLRINPSNPAALKAAQRFNVPIPDHLALNEATVPYQPTEDLRSDVVNYAMEQIGDALAEPVPEREKKGETQPEPIVEAEPPRNLRRFRMMALTALLIVVLIMAAAYFNADLQDRQEASTATSRILGATASQISGTNAAIFATQEYRATTYAATETLYYQTAIPVQTVNFANE